MLGEQFIYEVGKTQFGWDVVLEHVIGTFLVDGKLIPTLEHPADGAVVHWWLLNAKAPVHNLPRSKDTAIAAEDLIAQIDALQAAYPVRHTQPRYHPLYLF